MSRQPIICICFLTLLGADAALVKLHEKKDYRELDGGWLSIPRGKFAEAKPSRMILCLSNSPSLRKISGLSVRGTLCPLASAR
jgi:hypothetical protein